MKLSSAIIIPNHLNLFNHSSRPYNPANPIILKIQIQTKEWGLGRTNGYRGCTGSLGRKAQSQSLILSLRNQYFR
jgi:hypothetical protein